MNAGPGNGSAGHASSAAPPQPPSRRGSSHRRKSSKDGMDTVDEMERDASFSVVSQQSDLEDGSCYSSDDDDPTTAASQRHGSSFANSNDYNDDDFISSDDEMGQSARTHNSEFTSASRHAIDIRETTKPVTDEIARKWRLVSLLLGATATFVLVSLGGASAGLQKAKEDTDDQKEISSNNLVDTLVDANQEQQNLLKTSLDSFAAIMTQQAATSSEGGNWPLVTNPLFEVQGQYTRAMSQNIIEFIGFSPLVDFTQQTAWELYAREQQTWIEDSWQILENNSNTSNTNMVDSIAATIYEQDIGNGNNQNPIQFAPLWQTSPPPTDATIINQDMFSYSNIKGLFDDMMMPMTDDVLSMSGGSGGVLSPISHLDFPDMYGWGSSSSSNALVSDDKFPRSVMMIPVRNSLLTASTTGDENPSSIRTNNDVVGILQVVLNWETYLKSIIPNFATGTAILSNNCGQRYHYSVLEVSNGEANLELMDIGNTSSKEDSALSQNSISLGAVLGKGGSGKDSCSYKMELDILESSEAMNSNGGGYNDDSNSTEGLLVLTLAPLVIAIVLLGFTTFQFYQYQQEVSNRHEEMVKEAAKSSAIVASIFPSSVHDRLYAEAGHDIHGDEKDAKSTKKKRRKRKKTRKQKKRESVLKSNAGEKSDQPEDSAQEGVECSPAGGLQRAGSERLRSFLDGGLSAADTKGSAPIADLFPHCTVLFADIAGFTAWSSVREPASVFTLLETLYCCFDDIAKKRTVFKVETVGDCYVAVTGLPEPQEDHALIMVRFARDCLYKSYELTKKLEVTLGPDTAELSMRFGLHSGPVTAGVLRGERSRFQLFGDTVNTASRMESTGQKGRIQMSTETADSLVSMGKSHLVRQREDTVVAKGKGELTTFWVALGADREETREDDSMMAPPSLARNISGVESIAEGMREDASSSGDEGGLLGGSSSNNNTPSTPSKTDLTIGRQAPKRRKPPAVSMSMYKGGMSQQQIKKKKQSRLVDWMVEMLSKLLKHVIARRQAMGLNAVLAHVSLDRPEGQTVLEEVQEIITLPMFDASVAKKQEDPEKMELDTQIREQLHDYVCILFSMYRDNPFHNAEHASHVTMSVIKLLARIVAPKKSMTTEEKVAAELHDHTYGITSDPLTQFAVVLSALIHDVDHTGVPNSQLVTEATAIAKIYKGKSVAEQNSVDKSWELLMEPQFKELRNAIYCTDTELTRFRSLLVNSVMATDIVDKELKNLRNDRWDRAFQKGDYTDHVDNNERDTVNRKATIVIEHLIQASDVSHTMQHWHVYRKWNENLFHEMYNAFRQGRAAKDPSEFWYKGEIGFFDFYIIPLAKKLKDCGVFGVSSDEYLNYAIKNRQEWIQKGEAATAEMLAKARDKDYARLETQASMRGPVIAEMKAAVQTMRTPQKKQDMYRQASFRHLSIASEVSEIVAPPHSGFRRQPPTRGRRVPNHALSIGTAEREAMKNARNLRPTGSSQGPRRRSLLSDSESTQSIEEQIPELEEQQESPISAAPVAGMGTSMKRPQRKASMAL